MSGALACFQHKKKKKEKKIRHALRCFLYSAVVFFSGFFVFLWWCSAWWCAKNAKERVKKEKRNFRSAGCIKCPRSALQLRCASEYVLVQYE